MKLNKKWTFKKLLQTLLIFFATKENSVKLIRVFSTPSILITPDHSKKKKLKLLLRDYWRESTQPKMASMTSKKDIKLFSAFWMIMSLEKSPKMNSAVSSENFSRNKLRNYKRVLKNKNTIMLKKTENNTDHHRIRDQLCIFEWKY